MLLSGKKACLGLAAAWMVCVAAFGLALAPTAGANSAPGTVIFTPTSGPVGTSVQVWVNQPLTETTIVNYALGYTSTDPAAGGCASQQPFPGVAPFTSREGNGSATFNWPASLNKGPYWLCASPTSGNGKTVYSSQPYTVTAGVVPTATVNTTSGAIFADIPGGGGVTVGSTFTLVVRNWASPLGTPPDTVHLTPRDPSLPGSGDVSEINAPFTTAPGPSAGDYYLTVTVPEQVTIVPANYWAHVMDKAGGAYSDPFRISASAAATPVSVSSLHPGNMGSSSFPIIYVPIIAVLVCIAVLIFTVVFLRRRARSYR